MISLTTCFIDGLRKYNISFKEITTGNWKYCGGQKGRHLNYYKLINGDKELPEYKDKCICNHTIKENCYITNGSDLLILGNCCIKKFIPKSSRTCDVCNIPHQNRKINKCNECRKGLCDNCGKKCPVEYKKCYGCAFK